METQRSLRLPEVNFAYLQKIRLNFHQYRHFLQMPALNFRPHWFVSWFEELYLQPITSRVDMHWEVFFLS